MRFVELLDLSLHDGQFVVQEGELLSEVFVLLVEARGLLLEMLVLGTLAGQDVQLRQVVRHLLDAGLHGLAQALIGGEVPVVGLSVESAGLRGGDVGVQVAPGAAQFLELGDLRKSVGRQDALGAGAVALVSLMRRIVFGPLGGGGRGRVHGGERGDGFRRSLSLGGGSLLGGRGSLLRGGVMRGHGLLEKRAVTYKLVASNGYL